MVRSQLVRVHIVLTRIRHSAPSIWCSSSLPANDIWQLDPDLDFEPNTRYLFSLQYLKNRKKNLLLHRIHFVKSTLNCGINTPKESRNSVCRQQDEAYNA